MRIDDGFPQHPKLLCAGPLARDLFVSALCHCNRFLTDGKISMAELRALGHYEGLFTEGTRTLPGLPEPVLVDDVIERLIAANVMHFRNGVFYVHDYADYQPLKGDIEGTRARWREKKRRQRAGNSSFSTGCPPGTPGREEIKKTLETKDRGTRAREVCAECRVGAGFHAPDCSKAAAA